MSIAIRRNQSDPETLRTCDWQLPPRKPRKWYDWPLTILVLAAVSVLVTAVVAVKPYMRVGDLQPG